MSITHRAHVVLHACILVLHVFCVPDVCVVWHWFSYAHALQTLFQASKGVGVAFNEGMNGARTPHPFEATIRDVVRTREHLLLNEVDTSESSMTLALNQTIHAKLEAELAAHRTLVDRCSEREHLRSEMDYYKEKVFNLRSDRDNRQLKGKLETTEQVQKFDRNMKKASEAKMSFIAFNEVLCEDLRRKWDERVGTLGPALVDFLALEKKLLLLYSSVVRDVAQPALRFNEPQLENMLANLGGGGGGGGGSMNGRQQQYSVQNGGMGSQRMGVNVEEQKQERGFGGGSRSPQQNQNRSSAAAAAASFDASPPAAARAAVSPVAASFTASSASSSARSHHPSQQQAPQRSPMGFDDMSLSDDFETVGPGAASIFTAARSNNNNHSNSNSNKSHSHAPQQMKSVPFAAAAEGQKSASMDVWEAFGAPAASAVASASPPPVAAAAAVSSFDFDNMETDGSFGSFGSSQASSTPASQSHSHSHAHQASFFSSAVPGGPAVSLDATFSMSGGDNQQQGRSRMDSFGALASRPVAPAAAAAAASSPSPSNAQASRQLQQMMMGNNIPFGAPPAASRSRQRNNVASASASAAASGSGVEGERAQPKPFNPFAED